ncbi:MAG: transaldolase [Deltaproteobacteria bacterium]|nr:transaldolase [Deltaproteobacteria bacterium]
MPSVLEQLKAYTVVVADTGDFQSIRKFTPRDATTNPSLITAAAQMDEYQPVVNEALTWARRESGGDIKRAVGLAVDRLAVEFGLRILQIVPGRVSTEVDARLSYDTDASVNKARQLISQYKAAGVDKERILVKIASTWEGIRAAGILEKDGIHCNLTLLFGFHQAVACAEAGVRLISPFVGRILDWYVKNTGRTTYAPAEDPGVLSVSRIYSYYKKHGYKTEVMGASFRNSGEITELAGCDLLTISPKLLAELEGMQVSLPRKLTTERALKEGEAKIDMSEKIFRAMHQNDKMASDKLAEGIEGFSKALQDLEKLLEARLRA